MRRYNNNRHHQNDAPSSYNSQPNYAAATVMVKSKDVVCGFCKHKFYIGKELKGHNSPLLLPCGHATCNSCESIRPNQPCHCQKTNQVTTVERREKLPHNLYVIGLTHALSTLPMHAIEEPDFSFHVPSNARVRQNFDKGPCKECGMIAYYECKTCEALLCKACHKKMHKKVLSGHQIVVLNKNDYELPITLYCPNHEDDDYLAEYYCEDCDFDGCSHCMFKHHKNHNANAVSETNVDAMPELDAVLEQIDEAWRRTRQTKKDLTQKMVSQDASQLSEKTEQQLTQHFVYLHGVLQNLEARLKERLRQQRDSLKAEVEAFREKLDQQEVMLATIYGNALNAKSRDDTINIKKLAEKLADIADIPCHLVTNGDLGDRISLQIEKKWIEELKLNHIQLHVPENPVFSLLKTNELPDDYELEPIESDDTLSGYASNILDLSLRATSSRRDSPSPLASIASGESPANQSLDESVGSGGSVPAEYSSMPSRAHSERVKITCFNDPTDFYILKKSDERQFESIQTLIQNSVKTDVDPPSTITFNKVYIVQNSSDGKWYRARIIRESRDKKYEVFYQDIGMREQNVGHERIRKLYADLNIAPPMAQHCTLDEIVPMEGNDWDEETLMKFRSIIDGQILSMTTLRPDLSKSTVDLKLFNSTEEISLRELFLQTQNGKMNTFHKMKRINPLSTHLFYYEDLPIEATKWIKVKVLKVVSPNCIYVKQLEDKAFRDKMWEFQHEYVRALKHENLTIKTVEIDKAVAVEENLMYYRGYVTNIMYPKLEVFLVDTGETKTVKYSNVTHLPRRFCEWTAQAIKVSLVDIKPIEGSTYSNKAIVHLQKNLTNRTVKILPISKSAKGYGVVMLTMNETNVNANLVSINYAESTGQYSKHSSLNQDIRAPPKPRKKQTSKSNKQPSKPENLSFRDEQLKAQSEKRKLPNRRNEENDPFRIRVLLRKVISPDEIYVSDASIVPAYEAMNQQMQKFYSDNRSIIENEPEPGVNYCVYSPKDKQYCRANFLGMSKTRPNKARMSLIDLAEEIEVDVGEIQPLISRFFDVNKLTFRAKLAGITPCGGSKTWPSSSCRKLKEIIEDSGCDTKYYVNLSGSDKEDEIVSIDLCIRRNVAVGPTEPNRRESISVKRRLIEDGHAFPIRGYDDDKEKGLAVDLKKKTKLQNTMLDTSFFVEKTFEESKNKLTPIVEEDAVKIDFDNNKERETETDNNDKEIEEAEEDDDEEKASEVENAEEEEEENSVKDTSGDLLPPRIEDWIPAAHLIQDELVGRVTYVDYNCEVYFHPDTKEYLETFDYIKDTLDREYSGKSLKKYDTTWEVGDLCIANYHYDKKWYRAKVVDVESKLKTVKVCFVDYGNVEDCQIGALKKRITLTEIPIQVTRAAIAGLKPANGKWEEADLDIIHRALVDKKVKIKITSKPPKPWKALFWIMEGEERTYVPWFIQNKTQVKCIVENITETEDNDEADEFSFNDSPRTESTIQAVADESAAGFIIHVNENDSDDFSEEESVSLKSADDSDDDDSHTLKSGNGAESEHTIKMNGSGSSNESSSSASSRKRSAASVDSSDTSSSMNNTRDFINGNENEDNEDEPNGYEEQFLSGNSVYLANEIDANFDVQSVRSEALNSEVNFPLVASTPLNISFTEDDISFGPKDIDFFSYKVRTFQMSIGRALSPIRMTGYVVDCSNKKLKNWIEKNKVMHNEIQIYAEQQPELTPRKGAIGIAEYTDSEWYRAQVDKVTKTCTKVEFIDFGNSLDYKHGYKLRTAKNEWLELPRLSFNFKLYNVRISSGRGEDALNAMADILAEKDVWTASIKGYESVLEIELYEDKDCKELAYSSLIKDGLFEIIDAEVD